LAQLLQDLLATEGTASPLVIGRGVLPQHGKCILAGEPKSNKSWVVMNMAVALATGTPVFNAKYKSGMPVLPVTEAVRVLYCEQEMGQYGTRRRLLQMFPEAPPLMPLYIKTRDMDMRLDTPEGRVVIAGQIEEVKPQVLILDPMAQFHLSDENSAQHMSAVIRVLDRWVEEYGLSIILVHHVSKQNEEHPRKGGARIRGSSAIFGAIDTLIEVDNCSGESAKEPILRLGFTLRQDEALEPMYLRRRKNGWLDYLGEQFTSGRSQPTESTVKPATEFRPAYPTL
jgi:RecA-family ATPase